MDKFKIIYKGSNPKYKLQIFEVESYTYESIVIKDYPEDLILNPEDYLTLQDYNSILRAASVLNLDTMKLLAAVIYSCQYNEVTNDMRHMAKLMSFSHTYGNI